MLHFEGTEKITRILSSAICDCITHLESHYRLSCNDNLIYNYSMFNPTVLQMFVNRNVSFTDCRIFYVNLEHKKSFSCLDSECSLPISGK